MCPSSRTKTREGLVNAPEDLEAAEYCDEPEQDGNRSWNS